MEFASKRHVKARFLAEHRLQERLLPQVPRFWAPRCLPRRSGAQELELKA